MTRDALRAIYDEFQEILDEVYDWDESELRSLVVGKLESIIDDLYEVISSLPK